MANNFKKFIIKAVILFLAIYFTRVLFQFPVEYFGWKMLTQTNANKVFSKIDGLKIFASAGLFFALYYKKDIAAIAHNSLNLKKSLLFFITAELAVVLYYAVRFVNNYYDITGGLILYLILFLKLVALCAAFIFLTISIFQYDYILKFINNFRIALPIIFLVSIALYQILIYFQKQWFFFSEILSVTLYRALTPFYNVIYDLSQGVPILQINNFAISIGSPCSGIDSMLLFVLFFGSLFALDHRRLDTKMCIFFFILGFIGVYFVNVLRLLLLIIIGVHLSPELAVGLFHTNAGWLFFLLYFFLYFVIIKRFIYHVSIKWLKVGDETGK